MHSNTTISMLSDLKVSTLIIMLLDIKENSEIEEVDGNEQLLTVKLSNLLLADQILEEVITVRDQEDLLKEYDLIYFAKLVKSAITDLMNNLEECTQAGTIMLEELDEAPNQRTVH